MATVRTPRRRLASVLIPGLCIAAALTAAPLAQTSTPQGQVAEGQATFARDVAPILQRSCQTCHRPGSVAPMSLLTYEDARPWARSIKAKVLAREMPPWHVDRNIGITEFKNDPSLTDAEIATIAQWVDAVRRGQPGRHAAAAHVRRHRQVVDRQARRIVAMEKPYILPPTGPDNIVDVLIDPGFTEDMYISAIESKPLDPASFNVVHHFTTNLVEDPVDDQPACSSTNTRSARTPTSSAESGRLIKAGTKINFNLHLNPRGEGNAGDGSRWRGRCTEGVVPKYVAFTQHMGDAPELNIPAGAIRGTTATSGCHGRRSSHRSSRTCTTVARRSASRRSNRISNPTRHARARSVSRRSAASATISSAGTSRIRMPTTWRRCCRRHDHPRDLLARQHRRQPVESQPEKLGGWRLALDRRDELLVDHDHIPRRGRLPSARRQRRRLQQTTQQQRPPAPERWRRTDKGCRA